MRYRVATARRAATSPCLPSRSRCVITPGAALFVETVLDTSLHRKSASSALQVGRSCCYPKGTGSRVELSPAVWPLAVRPVGGSSLGK